MKEVREDFWKIMGEWKCIPTNGEVKKNGEAVMEVGLANQAAIRLPQFPRILGKMLSQEENNRVHYIGNWDFVRYYSFPTKNSWREKSSLSLIEQSCGELLILLNKQIEINKLDNRTAPLIVLPKVGCGGLDYEEQIKPLLLKYFDNYDNVIISMGK